MSGDGAPGPLPGGTASLKAGAAAVAGLAAYAFIEPYLFRLVERRLPVTSGATPLSVLHLSDLHIAGRERLLPAWLRSLPQRLGETPDVVLATGDLITDDPGIDPVVDLLGGIDARLGRFYVLGSHDYFRARFHAGSLLKYFRPDRRRVRAPAADTPRLERGLAERGWIPLTNRSEVLTTPHGRILLAGVDDPYLRRHRLEHVNRRPDDALAIGVVHAPDVVSQWMLAGFDLVVAGHTHGGQVRLPFAGALVTNCTVPTGLAAGLHRVGRGWLHVSPGLGTGRYTPVRFNCRPEATLLRLVPGDG